ncbi:MAG TPA: hypothetical protein VJB57_02225 [Dehalococcoidia bacterium]|nr:hypothetical protein [Dehalococcoidia bacterium]
MDPEALLQKHKPWLVLRPQNPSLQRPGWDFDDYRDEEYGDYHPCSAEFFLSLVEQRDGPRKWNPLFFLDKSGSKPTGIDALKDKVAQAGRDSTKDWELDIAPIRSQDAARAWHDYPELKPELNQRPKLVYGHYVGGQRHVLEYWYLYAYNDAPNRHEGDWEMVAIEVDGDGNPIAACYSGHSGGFWRKWDEVDRGPEKGDRPYVYVGRGSHAAYFFHDPDGHVTNSLEPRKGWVEPFESAWVLLNKGVQGTMSALRLKDWTTSALKNDPPTEADTVIDSDLVILPDVDKRDGRPELWWMDLRCAWGSRHSRFRATIGPPPPWEQVSKWETPADWMDKFKPKTA